MLLRETKAPNLLVTLHQEEPGTGSDQIAKLNPCAGPNLCETSINSRFQDQSTLFDVDIDTYLPSTPIQPDIKPLWNLYKVVVY